MKGTAMPDPTSTDEHDAAIRHLERLTHAADPETASYIVRIIRTIEAMRDQEDHT